MPRTGSSLEVDTLTETFNTLMATSVRDAEAETRSAYVGAIRALALALDARDPYTAGHSERVSAISVAVGQQMGLNDDELDIAAARRAAPRHRQDRHQRRRAAKARTADGRGIRSRSSSIRAPARGSCARVPFLARAPADRRAAPRAARRARAIRTGCDGDEIPMLARIVHVADAFDAMTSARAYRPARGARRGAAGAVALRRHPVRRRSRAGARLGTAGDRGFLPRRDARSAGPWTAAHDGFWCGARIGTCAHKSTASGGITMSTMTRWAR